MLKIIKNIIFLLILIYAAEIYSLEEFVKFSSGQFKYSVEIPKSWRRSQINLGYKEILFLEKNMNTGIKIYAAYSDRDEIKKWASWKEWYIKGTGRNLKLILEKNNVHVSSKIDSRLVVFQYSRRNRKILNRMLISRFGNVVQVIQCSAPVAAFYKYDAVFNRVMRSLQTNL